MKSHKIHIKTSKAGRGETVLITEICPFEKGGICSLEHIQCRYGLTEVKVPKPACPISSGLIQEFSLEEIETDD